MNVCVFDIETIPDVENGRRLHDLNNLSDSEVADAMFSLRRQETNGSDFLRLHCQKIVAISIVLYNPQQIKVWSLGDVDSSESDLIERFYAGIDKYTPMLVSWNGAGFDLPVLHYRSLQHSISAPRYWETGESDPNFRWNNYLNRYHDRHLDLMEVLSGYQARANAPLDQIATMLGFPGKMGMSGKYVWQAYQQGECQSIRDYCETDVLNTFLVFLRFQLMRGRLDHSAYQQECQRLKTMLSEQDAPHLQQFLTTWIDYHGKTTT